ncbi:MAG: cation diffusion facilitator family transporter [Allobranchiibius sp.]|nr:cation diffusion facilitator family transporter [Actinomycetota bacterium]
MSTEGGNTAILAALGANLGIAVTKLVAFALTGMSSMLAEGIHSLADSGNQILLLVGGKRAKKEATPEHPFGYGRERYVFGFLVSIVLFSLGGLFALYEAYHKAHEAHSGEGTKPGIDQAWWWVPIVVLLAAIVLEGFSFRTAVRESNPLRGDASWPQFIRRAKAPELPVILLEDFAALIGLAFALFGVVLSVATGSSYWDAAGTALIGLLLVGVAVVLAVETKSLLIGESATPEVRRNILAAIGSAPGVDRIIHAKTLHLGPEELLVAVKIAVGETDTGEQVARAIDAAEQRARAAAPDLRLVMYLEPDLDREQARESS